ncbi:MAG TPA: type II toxin-antitoxin system RelE/ParE family toxin [Casimicrobiaceae bacterium]|nr:type II toxin-antitoxin system RelE/ParE family toxin [Casimicrobiaceae bacterium]
MPTGCIHTHGGCGGERRSPAWRLWSVPESGSTGAGGRHKVMPGSRLEKLCGDRSGQYSIRINDQWRICLRWRYDGPWDVEIVDLPLGRKHDQESNAADPSRRDLA